MDFSILDLKSIENILADVLVAVDDPEAEKLTIGWYKRRVKRAIDELGYETYFLVQFQDFDVPNTAKMLIPSGAWNIRNIYVFNGDNCNMTTFKTVHHKDNFLTRGRSCANTPAGYTARNSTYNNDPFYNKSLINENTLYYNVVGGEIFFSDTVLNYENVRIEYNGTPSNIDTTNIIPPFVAEAVIAMVVEAALASLKVRDPKLRGLWMDARIDSKEKVLDAKYRLKHLSKGRRDDLNEYLSRMNY